MGEVSGKSAAEFYTNKLITARDSRADGGGQVDQHPTLHARSGDTRQADQPRPEEPEGK